MSQIKITKHAIERFRERMTEDVLRVGRTDKRIREMINEAVIASDRWEQLKEQMECGQKKEYKLRIRVFDGWDFIGAHKAVLVPSKRGKSYTIVTFV